MLSALAKMDAELETMKHPKKVEEESGQIL